MARAGVLPSPIRGRIHTAAFKISALVQASRCASSLLASPVDLIASESGPSCAGPECLVLVARCLSLSEGSWAKGGQKLAETVQAIG